MTKDDCTILVKDPGSIGLAIRTVRASVKLRANRRQTGGYPETGFEEIQSACGSQGFHFPPSGLERRAAFAGGHCARSWVQADRLEAICYKWPTIKTCEFGFAQL